MPADLEQIAAIRSQALQQLADITSEPKPSYVVDGQRVDWAEYADSLRKTVAWCDEKSADHDPFEIHTWGAS